MSKDSTNTSVLLAPNKTPHAAPQKPAGPKSLNVFTTILMGGLLYWVPAFLAVLAIQIIFMLLLLGGKPFDFSANEIEHFLTNTTFSQFLYVAITEIFAIILLIFLMRATRETWRTIGVRWPKWRHAIYTFGGLAAYFGIYIVAAMILSGVLDFDQKQELGFDDQIAGSALIWVFISLVILPPIVEEILFRGFLYTRFKRFLSMRTAAVAVSILFAVAHLQFGSGNPLLWTAALDTFILSLVLVYVREKTGTIWAGVGIHALKNLIAFSILFVFV